MSEIRELFMILQKYMKHVELSEGVTFVSNLNEHDVKFSPKEINFLKTVEQQIQDDE